MSIVRSAVLLALLSASAGCYNVKYYSTAVPGPGETHRIWVHSFVGGIITIGEINLDAQCPNGVYKVKSNFTFVDLLLFGVTSGIYTPMNVVVTCGTAPGATN